MILLRIIATDSVTRIGSRSIGAETPYGRVRVRPVSRASLDITCCPYRFVNGQYSDFQNEHTKDFSQLLSLDLFLHWNSIFVTDFQVSKEWALGNFQRLKIWLKIYFDSSSVNQIEHQLKKILWMFRICEKSWEWINSDF